MGQLNARNGEQRANPGWHQVDEEAVAPVAVAEPRRAGLKAAHEGRKGSRSLRRRRHSHQIDRIAQADDEAWMPRGQT
jgi:hypothetical protein